MTWQVPAPQPASISLSSVSFFLPEEKSERVSQRRWPEVTLGQPGEGDMGHISDLGGYRRGSPGDGENLLGLTV